MKLKLSVIFILLALFAAACAPAQPGAAVVNPASSGNSSATPLPASQGGNSALPVTGNGEIKYVVVPDKTVADYRVREQLARLSFPSDAVGKTNAVSGGVVIKPDGSIDSAQSKFTVDLSTLTSDEGMRDNFVRRSILDTNQYPQAVFVPTQVSGLPSPMPQSGQVSFKVTGNLTIKDVTKPVTWDVSGQITNGEAIGTATTSFTFEDFNLPQPHVPVVLSVVDKITLEVALDLKPAS
jgi:polyisoprenoid-binding protein YceI